MTHLTPRPSLTLTFLLALLQAAMAYLPKQYCGPSLATETNLSTA